MILCINSIELYTDSSKCLEYILLFLSEITGVKSNCAMSFHIDLILTYYVVLPSTLEIVYINICIIYKDSEKNSKIYDY